MAEQIKTLEEARALIAEYNSLPDDLTARLNWKGYDRLPETRFVCTCGKVAVHPVDFDGLVWMVEHNQFELEKHTKYCYHEEQTEEDDDEEESEEDDD